MFGDGCRTPSVVATAMGGVPSDVYTATVKSNNKIYVNYFKNVCIFFLFSGIMSRNGTVRTTSPSIKLASTKVHPAPSPPRQIENGHQNNLGEGTGRNESSWPTVGIPTRVKKLSWGDDSQNKVLTFHLHFNYKNVNTHTHTQNGNVLPEVFCKSIFNFILTNVSRITVDTVFI